MQLISIHQHREANEKLARHPLCRHMLQATLDFYQPVGFNKPWIGCFVEENGKGGLCHNHAVAAFSENLSN